MKSKNSQIIARRVAAVFSILSDPTRCRIIMFLSTLKPGEGRCVYEIAEAIGLTHSATSHQLNKMERLGIVECYREGQMMCYYLTNSSFVNKLLSALRLFYK